MAFVVFTRDEPPQHVQKWKRGADGERLTEKTLRPFERHGWTVEHDVQRDGRANLDHVVTGPLVSSSSRRKTLGAVTFEDGILVVRQFDDPDEVYRSETLAPRLRGQAMELSGRVRTETGRKTWMTAVVAIWGHFPSDRIEHDNVTYIRGDELYAWLASVRA